MIKEKADIVKKIIQQISKGDEKLSAELMNKLSDRKSLVEVGLQLIKEKKKNAGSNLAQPVSSSSTVNHSPVTSGQHNGSHHHTEPSKDLAGLQKSYQVIAEQVEAQQANLQTTINYLQRNIDALEASNDELSESFQKSEKERKVLSQRVADLQQMAKTTIEYLIRQQKLKVGEWEEIETLLEDWKDLIESEGIYGAIRKLVSEFKQLNDKFEKETLEKVEELTTLTENKEGLLLKQKELIHEIQSLKEELDVKSREYQEQEQEWLKEVVKKEEENQKLAATLKAQSVSKIEQVQEAHQQEVRSLKADILKQEEALTKAENLLESFKKENASVVSEKETEIENLKAELHQLQIDKETLQKEKEQELEDAISELEKENFAALEQKQKEASEEVGKLKAEIGRLKEEQNKLLEAKDQELQSAISEIEKEKLAAIQREQAEAQAEIDRLIAQRKMEEEKLLLSETEQKERLLQENSEKQMTIGRLQEELKLVQKETLNIKDKYHASLESSLQFTNELNKSYFQHKKNLEEMFPSLFYFSYPDEHYNGNLVYVADKFGVAYIVIIRACFTGLQGQTFQMVANFALNNIIKVKKYINSSKLIEEFYYSMQPSLMLFDKLSDYDHSSIEVGVCLIDKENLEVEFSSTGFPVIIRQQGKYNLLQGGKESNQGDGNGVKRFGLNNQYKVKKANFIPNDEIILSSSDWDQVFVAGEDAENEKELKSVIENMADKSTDECHKIMTEFLEEYTPKDLEKGSEDFLMAKIIF